MIRLIAIGKIKENWINEGIEQYGKRIHVKVIQIKDTCPEIEGQKILEILKDNELVVALSEEGDAMTSIEMAKLVKGQDVCFVIGGPYGLSNDVKIRADIVLSISNMTFTHEMARLFLMEQIYRAKTINQNKGYHHA